MTDTNRLGLPLLQPAQAQKHVTVNEAFGRLDGLVGLTLVSQGVVTPPAVVIDGVCYAVPAGAINSWAGQTGKIAIGMNGGWDFATPQRGWRAFILDEGGPAVWNGTGWQSGAVTLSANNAGLSLAVAEIDHSLTSGTVETTTDLIPANAVVVGVTARVTSTITGTLSSWQLGNPGAVGRFGSGLGLSTGSWARGVLGQPTAFYSATAMQLNATGGGFSGGTVRIAAHYFELNLPDM